MNPTLQDRYRKAIEYLFRAIVATPAWIRDYAVCNLIPTPSMLRGAPGVGKTTLSRAAAKVLFGQDAVILNFYEEAGLEDLVFDMDIGQEHLDKRSTYTFQVKPRAYMGSRFALCNEMNRGSKPVQNGFLSIWSEGFIEVRGKRLQKTLGKTWVDYNPYYGDLDAAMADRIGTSLVMDELDLLEQSALAARKYDGGHVTDLVANLEPQLSSEDLLAIWDDVTKVEIPKRDMVQALLSINVFRNCVHKLGSVSEAFRERLQCDECSFQATCITKMLRRPILTRAMDAAIHAAKAFAWFDGRSEVSVRQDLMPALRLVIPHRAELREEAAKAHTHVLGWFDEAVAPVLRSRKDDWLRAKAVYDQIDAALRADDPKTAGTTLKEYRGKAKDITALRLVEDFAMPKLEARADLTVREILTKTELLRAGQAVYTAQDLTELESDLAWLPESKVKLVSEAIGSLRFRLTGTLSITEPQLRKLRAELARLDPGSITELAEINRRKTWAGGPGNLAITPQGHRFEVSYVATSSELADIFDRVTLPTA